MMSIHCKQINCNTNVCDWYECPHGATCDVVKRFYQFIQTNDEPNDVQSIDGVLFYTAPSSTVPQLNKTEREEVAKQWINDEQVKNATE